MSALENGRWPCPLAEYPEAWVKFREKGYPFRLRRELDLVATDVAVLPIILPYVVEWNLPDVNGRSISLPEERPTALLDDVDEMLVVWLIRTFYEHRAGLMRPRPNLSAPSSST